MDGGRGSMGVLAREGIVHSSATRDEKHEKHEKSKDGHEKREKHHKRGRDHHRDASKDRHSEVECNEDDYGREKRGARRRHRAKPSDNTTVESVSTPDFDVNCAARPPPMPPTGPPVPSGMGPKAPSGIAPPPGAMSLKQRVYGGAGSPLVVRPPHAIVPVAFTNMAPPNHVVSTGSFQSCNSNTSASVVGSRAGSACESGMAPVSLSRDSTPGGSTSPIHALANQSSSEPLSLEHMSMEELRLENLRLQREVDLLRDRLLVTSTGRTGSHGASGAQRVVGGGFRGSAIRMSTKGSEVTEKEADALRQVVQQKSSKIYQLEDLLKAMKADAQSQERMLERLQRSLSDASEEISAVGAQRQVLEQSMDELNKQLDSERQKTAKVERSAAQLSASEEELRLELQAEQAEHSKACGALEVRSSACTVAEARAAALETKLASALELADQLETVAENNQAEALRKLQCLEVRNEMSQRYLCALGYRQSVLRLCWEAWNQIGADRNMAEEMNNLRGQVAQTTARASLRSASGREEHAELHAELERLRCTSEEATTLEAQLRSREGDLEACSSELSQAEALASSLRSETAQLLEAASGHETLNGELSELRAQEARLRHGSEDLESRLGEARASCVAENALAREALEARDACAAREAALKTRAADLEQRLAAASSTPAVSSTAAAAPAVKRPSIDNGAAAKAAVAAAALAEKHKQREETLLRETRSAEKERDEARRNLQNAEKSVARIPGLEREAALEQQLTQKLKTELDEGKLQQEQQRRQQAQLDAETKERLGRERVSAALESNEQTGSLRSELAEMKKEFGLATVDVRRLRQAREELQADLKGAREEASTSSTQLHLWKDAVEDAMKQVKNSLRILVTAPKVCINIGGDEFDVQRGAIHNDINQIRSIVSERVLPTFQKIMAVADGEDETEVRGAVMKMVEELAEKVQQEVYRVLPQAEGTASWDGFGARASGVR